MGDAVSLLALLLVVVSILISVGLHKDFFHAFRIAFGRKGGRNLGELRRAKEAVDLVIKAVAGSGCLGFCVGVIESSYIDKDNLTSLPICIGVATISLLYSVIFILFLIPVQSRLKIKIMEYMGE